MNRATNRLAGWAAILAIAAQAVFGPSALPGAQAAAIDPLAVICHTGAPADDRPAPADLPAQACDHCVLCNATAAALPPAAPSLSLRLAPLRAQRALAGLIGPSAHFIVAQNLARGPPAA